MFALIQAVFAIFLAWLLDIDEYASIEDLKADRARLARRIEQLHARYGGEPFDATAKDLWNAANTELDELDAAIGQATKREARLHEIAAAGGAFPATSFTSEAGGGGGGFRDRALRLIDRAHSRESEIGTHLSDQAASSLSRLVRDQDPQGALARQLAAVANPAYSSWWDKQLRHGQMAGGHLTREEIDAREQVELVERALGVGTGAGGGYLLPFDLDPTILLTNNGAINPIREIARVVQTTQNEFRGVTSLGGTASFDPEAAEVSDDTPILGQPVCQLDRATYFVPFSIELDQDSGTIRRELFRVASDARANLEADKYLNGAGHGSNEPSGVIASPAPATVSTTIAALDTGLTSAIEAVPSRFRAGATWTMPLNVINRISLLESTAGARKFPSIDADRLLGRPVREWSNITGGTTSGNLLSVVGDFDQYLIADRVGMFAEVIPHMFGTAFNRPTGQRGFFAMWRTGGTALIAGAFRQLKVT